jgi:hypothetical protein
MSQDLEKVDDTGKIDRRKFNGGKSTAGYAGRKSAVIEQNVRAAIVRAAGKDKKMLDRVWKKIFEKAEAGSEKHIRILFEYWFGRPVENIKLETKQFQVRITRTIVSVKKDTDKKDGHSN